MSDPKSYLPPDGGGPEPDGGNPVHHTSHIHSPAGGHGIWTWDVTVSVWILIEDKSEPGFEVGPGPTGPGRFHGQTVRWACVPKKD